MAREGRRVTLVDRAEPGRGTSFGNAGHIATEQVFPLASPEVVRGALGYLLDPESPLRIRPAYALRILPWLARFAWASRRSRFERGVAAISSLQATAARDLATLLDEAGARDLLHLDGHLVLVEDAASMAAAKAEVELMARHGIPADWIPPEEVRALAPEITAPIEGAWKFRATGHVDDPFAVSRAMEAGFRAAGGEVVQADIAAIESNGAGFTARTCEGRAIEARRVVLSCGAFSKPLAASLGYRVPLDTERGYHVTLPKAFPSFRFPIASFDRKAIMTPMTAGLRMTGTVELGGLELPPDANRWAMLERNLQALVPSMPREGMTTWMGFRPSLPDHLPVLGRAPDGRQLYFAFGHQHLGLTLSGVTARVIADAVAGRDPGIDLAPFRADRF
ncbi:MAG TPA: FAD-binding oxidoreductase [Usitatibacter sp.]|nr:FAD-binding oxidoreductase [Usitatibacter sp.]